MCGGEKYFLTLSQTLIFFEFGNNSRRYLHSKVVRGVLRPHINLFRGISDPMEIFSERSDTPVEICEEVPGTPQKFA
jgi:hypothetical protein